MIIRTHKRALVAASFVVLSMVAAACGSTGAAGTTQPATSTGSASSESVSTGGSPATSGQSSSAASGQSGSAKVTMQLIVGVSGSPFYEAMQCGAKQEAASLGVDLKIAAPSQFAAAQQLPLLNAATSAHPDAIAIVPTDPVALNAGVQAAIKAGIKVLTVDQTLSNTSGILTQIISNNEAGGKQAADEMAKEIGAKGKVLVLTTEPGQVTSQDQRAKGFTDALKAYPGIEYVGAQYSNDTPALTASQVTASLGRFPDLAGIFATNDQSGIGAVSGLKSAKATGKVKLIAYDAAVSQVQSLQSGATQALIAQDPRTEGIDAVKSAVAAVQGKTVPPTINTATQLLTSTTPVDVLQKFEYQGNC